MATSARVTSVTRMPPERRQDEALRAFAGNPSPCSPSRRSAMCSLSKRSASSLTVMACRSASRLAAGSSPFLAAAMIVIARLRACSQVSTVLGPRLMRRERRPARY